MIVGFSGAKGSGKDLAYRILKEKYSHLNIEKIAFADPIRLKLFEIFNLNNNTYDILKRSLINISNEYGTITTVGGRDIVRGIGMLMRSYDENQFVKYVYDKVIANTDIIYICTDVRFQNEVEMFEKLGAKIALIQREGFDYDNHPSERLISKYDKLIVNDNIDNFKKQVVDFFEECL